MNELNTMLNKLEKLCNPVSIFLYGSRARTDFLQNSDFEIGVLIPQDRYIRRSEIKKRIKNNKFSIYPFEYEKFVNFNIDTPFQKAVYLREFIIGGRTLIREKIIENLQPPAIKVIDIIQDLRFNIGYAFASMHSYRNGDKETASYEFYKSCLYGLRNLEILKFKNFPVGFKEIYKLSKKLKLGEYKLLVNNAYKLRLGKIKFQEKYLFQNLSFLNEFIEPQIMKYFKKYGNKILIK